MFLEIAPSIGIQRINHAKYSKQNQTNMVIYYAACLGVNIYYAACFIRSPSHLNIATNIGILMRGIYLVQVFFMIYLAYLGLCSAYCLIYKVICY